MSSYVSSLIFDSSDAVRLKSYIVSTHLSFNYSVLKLLSFVYFSFGIINKVCNTILVLSLFTKMSTSLFQWLGFKPGINFKIWLNMVGFSLAED
jgi:hypothetical protein